MDEATLRSSGLVALIACAALAGVVVLAIIHPPLIIELSTVDFVVVTCLLGGWAATMTGRAIASTWRPYWHVVFYAVMLALVVRWVHWALFQGTLNSLHYYLVDFVVLASLASLGYRTVRTYQMTTQYRWLYERRGPFGWARVSDNS
jgi:hypothetical protein